LYIGGEFYNVNGQVTGGLISYDGMNWDSLPGNPLGWPINDITEFQGKIYAGGTNGLASWDGMKWECIDCGIGARVVWELHVYKKLLIVGGNFTNIGGSGLHTLVAWDGNNFSEVFGSQSVFNLREPLKTMKFEADEQVKSGVYFGK